MKNIMNFHILVIDSYLLRFNLEVRKNKNINLYTFITTVRRKKGACRHNLNLKKKKKKIYIYCIFTQIFVIFSPSNVILDLQNLSDNKSTSVPSLFLVNFVSSRSAQFLLKILS